MTIPRIYQPISLSLNTEISLDTWGIQHVKALRLRQGDTIILFNGEDGAQYQGQMTTLTAKAIRIKLLSKENPSTESSLMIQLLQAVSRGERMDYTVQKATELGVTIIIPVISEYCEVRLSNEGWQKRQQRWQQIAMSACEQTGRTCIPTITLPESLPQALENHAALSINPRASTNNARRPPLQRGQLKIVLDPDEQQTLVDMAPCFNQKPESVSILIGPEGGLTPAEIQLAKQHHFKGLRIGPRILRTETAGVVILAAIHARWGDFIL